MKLIDHWKGTTSSPVANSGDEVRIHALYGGRRADGIYRRSTKCIDIISGPGAGCVGLKPSPATAEVIKAVNPKVSPVEISSTDASGVRWRSSAVYRADAAGGIDLSNAPALSGSYHGVSGMGLIWKIPRGRVATLLGEDVDRAGDH